MLHSVMPNPCMNGTPKRSSKAAPHSGAIGTAIIRRRRWSRSRSVGGWRKMNSGITPRPFVIVASAARTSSSQLVARKRSVTTASAPAMRQPRNCMSRALAWNSGMQTK